MSAASLHASAVRSLTRWEACDPEQDSLRHAYLAFLAAADTACLRACAAGHLTASAIVFDSTGSHVLLTLHPRVGKWVQLGGHCEPNDDSIVAAAGREAAEESGIDDLRVLDGIVRLHTHPITCSLGIPTRHLDVQFAAVAPPVSDGSLPAIECSSESVDLRWWPIDDLPAGVDTSSVPALVEFGRRKLARGE